MYPITTPSALVHDAFHAQLQHMRNVTLHLHALLLHQYHTPIPYHIGYGVCTPHVCMCMHMCSTAVLVCGSCVLYYAYCTCIRTYYVP